MSQSLHDLTKRLHDDGWARHVTAIRLLEDRERLAAEVNDHPLTVDDFTNDLTGRDGLERLLHWASPALAADLQLRVDAADERYREGTVEDGGAALGRHCASMR